MKTRIFLWILAGATQAGCASVTIRNYIREEHPYRKTFYAPYDAVLEATVQSLKDSGWEISKKTDPAVFERNRDQGDHQVKQVLLFTDVRQMALVLGTRYARMNIYLQSSPSGDNSTDVELRYLTVTSVSLKNFYNYRNDGYARKLFERIGSRLK